MKGETHVNMSLKLYDIFVGSETGLLKGVDTRKGNWVNINSIKEADRQKEIVTLCWGNDEETEICAGLRDQTVVVYNADSTSTSYNFSESSSHLKGLEKIDNNFITCCKAGFLRCWTENGEIKLEKTVGENVYRMRSNHQQRNIIATGGKENDLKIWDLQKPDNAVFAAKNVRHNWLNLRVPVWILDIGFIPDSQKVVTSTSHHQVRLYDLRESQRRPVLDMTYGEAPITTLSVRSNGHQVLVGNSQGQLGLLDVRGKGHLVQAFKGCGGGVRNVSSLDSAGLVFSCGLDRNLRIHDIKTKNLLHTFYLKSRLNCLLLREQVHNGETEKEMPMNVSQDKESGEKSDEDDDTDWFNSQIMSKKGTSSVLKEKVEVKKKKNKKKKKNPSE